MKPINSETTGFQKLGKTLPNSIGTQPGETGSVVPLTTDHSAALPLAKTRELETLNTTLRPHLENSATISELKKIASTWFRDSTPAMTEQSSICKQVAQVVTAGPAPDVQTALHMAAQLTGCFRLKDYANAQTFGGALAATFQAYPEAAGRMVIDPVNGLPSHLKFPPSIAEVREALDKRVSWAKSLLRAMNRAEAAQ